MISVHLSVVLDKWWVDLMLILKHIIFLNDNSVYSQVYHVNLCKLLHKIKTGLWILIESQSYLVRTGPMKLIIPILRGSPCVLLSISRDDYCNAY